MSDYFPGLNPIGNGDPVCQSLGHQWEPILFDLADRIERRYRACDRCDRAERLVGGKWEVNKLEVGTV